MHMKTLLVLVVLAGFLAGCKEDPPPSLFDPNYAGGPQPVVTAIVPAAGSPPPNTPLAGVTVITLTGSNFSVVPENNLVFFDAERAQVLEASATQLRVKAPLLIKDSIKVKVAVLGSELFSETILYKLEPAAELFGNLAAAMEPFGMTVDIAGNVYVSVLSGGVRDSVYKITPDGVRTGFSIGLSSAVPRWGAMRVGPGFIYVTARNAIFRIPIAGGNAAGYQANLGPATSAVNDLDFDQQGNLWTAGTSGLIFRITPTTPPTVKSFSFPAETRSVRVFNSHLYAGGLTLPDSVEKVVRFPIVSADSLGPREDVFNFSSTYPGARILAVTFALTGEMFIGTDSSGGSIVMVRPDGSSEKFYPGILSGQSITLAYGTGVDLYVSRSGATNAAKKVIKVNTQKQSAPYYGRQ
jgi:hypothetical protein